MYENLISYAASKMGSCNNSRFLKIFATLIELKQGRLDFDSMQASFRNLYLIDEIAPTKRGFFQQPIAEVKPEILSLLYFC